jgi:RNA polymerase sigma factor for flagellar operon FliA
MSTGVEHGDEQILWDHYHRNPTPDQREVLITRYIPLANRLAAQLYAGRQVYEIEFNEYRQYALIGLIESIDRYDPARGASFATYSGHRIRGAILNGVEKYSEKQQQISARARLRQERFEDLLKEATAIQQEPLLQMVDVAIGIAIGYLLEDSGMYRGSDDEGYEHNVYSSKIGRAHV